MASPKIVQLPKPRLPSKSVLGQPRFWCTLGLHSYGPWFETRVESNFFSETHVQERQCRYCHLTNYKATIVKLY